VKPAPGLPPDITSWLRRAASGDAAAEERLLGAVYRELRRMAARHLRRERRGHTLQPTDLLNEAYLRLMRGRHPRQWANRSHFFAMASTVMRRVLVDHARRRAAGKRDGQARAETLPDAGLALAHSPERIIAVDRALSELAVHEPRQARIVELRFFAGLTDEEVANALGISSRTVKRDWAAAKARLYARLAEDSRG
jgi:RNA polymerase sigma factor (TIGR02999 family)